MPQNTTKKIKKLTETIHGTIAFSSELGKGSSFVVTLPQKALNH